MKWKVFRLTHACTGRLAPPVKRNPVRRPVACRRESLVGGGSLDGA